MFVRNVHCVFGYDFHLWSVVQWQHLLELPRKIQCFGQSCVNGVSLLLSDYCSGACIMLVVLVFWEFLKF
jgi:hypothetical protein